MAVHIFSVRDTMILSGLCFAFADIERKHSRFKQLVKFYEKNIIDLEGKNYTESGQSFLSCSRVCFLIFTV